MPTIDELISSIKHKYEIGNLPSARAECLEALRENPANADVHHLLGLVYQQEGDMNNAFRSFQDAARIDPGSANAHYSTGVILQHAGKMEAAEAAYRKALDVDPGLLNANCNLGALLHGLGKPDEAAVYYKRALSADPDNHLVEYNLAHALKELQQFELAEEHFHSVLEKNQDFPEAWFNLGVTFSAQGKNTEALECYKKTVHLHPGQMDAHNNIGTILMANGDYAAAVNAFRTALKYAPDNPKLHFNTGTALKETGQYSAAIKCFDKTLALDPDFNKAYAELCRCNQIICEWRSDTYNNRNLTALAMTCIEEQLENPVYPFDALSLPVTAEVQREIAASHARKIAQNAGMISHTKRKIKKSREQRLHIGYVSQKFNNHAGAHLIASLFGQHDREKYKIHAYSISKDDGSIWRSRIKEGSEYFIDLSGNNFKDCADRIYNDRIDILVDLGVYNTFSRTEIFALRPAPIQVSYLGYPGTSGSDFYDYILTDRTVTPPDQQQWYTEKFAYLPHCYQVNDHQLDISGNIPDKAGCGLPESAFVFCSFNNSYKIEPDIFSVWMKILSSVPDAVLWLLDHSRETTDNLRNEAEMRGINGNRLIFAEKLDKNLHLARHQHADLFLDTLYYNAHTTASDSLRVGVPVVTTPGNTFASRVAASLLNTIDLNEMVTENLQEYEHLAVRFASDKSFSSRIVSKLRHNIGSSPLFDTPAFARHLEHTFEKMWEIYASGQSVQQISP